MRLPFFLGFRSHSQERLRPRSSLGVDINRVYNKMLAKAGERIVASYEASTRRRSFLKSQSTTSFHAHDRSSSRNVDANSTNVVNHVRSTRQRRANRSPSHKGIAPTADFCAGFLPILRPRRAHRVLVSAFFLIAATASWVSIPSDRISSFNTSIWTGRSFFSHVPTPLSRAAGKWSLTERAQHSLPFRRSRPHPLHALATDDRPSSPVLPVRLAVLAPLADPSALGNATWGEVLAHMKTRLSWTDESYHLTVHDLNDYLSVEKKRANTRDESPSFISEPSGKNAVDDHISADILVVVGVTQPEAVAKVLPLMQGVATAVPVSSVEALSSATTKIGGMTLSSVSRNPTTWLPGPLASLYTVFDPQAKRAKTFAQAASLVTELYSRRTADDLLYSFLVLINAAVRPVPAVANDTRRADAGPDAVICMVKHCLKEIGTCLSDSTCKTALDCLNTCAFNDQVCSYRCIASYESPALQAFSLCILQKHNCLGLHADIPMVPDPAPMSEYHGESLTHEVAEGMFVGWLKGAQPSLLTSDGDAKSQAGKHSWRVFAGKNAAYDHFPCQFQLFYRGKGKNQFWYQPVFKVETVDGREVWRDRVYRVRRGQAAGSFYMSVLDNGVTSNEFWRVLDCDEGLEWCMWFYSGAASAAGLSYSGAILASRTGEWPSDASTLQRIESGLDRAGIKLWELSTVRNVGCQGAPLQPASIAGF